MPKFEAYNIALKELPFGTHLFEYKLDNDFFKKIDSPEVQRGDLSAKVKVTVHQDSFSVLFEVDGKVYIPCDRCLDDMEQEIHGKDELQVKLGADYSDEGDTMIIPETDGALNIAWFLYEMIVLAIPLKHVHAPGLCNKTMAMKLKKHLAHNEDSNDEVGFEEDVNDIDDDFQTTDPRWDGLKDILEDN